MRYLFINLVIYMGLSSKMKDRLKEIENLSKNGNTEEQIKTILFSKGWHKDKVYRTIATFKAGCVVIHSKPKCISLEKKYLNDSKCCFFCDKEKTIQHHISYVPEKLIFICESCHFKLHNLIKEYHKQTIEKDNILKFVVNGINDLNKRVNLLKKT